jgi:hypothetical protein
MTDKYTCPFELRRNPKEPIEGPTIDIHPADTEATRRISVHLGGVWSDYIVQDGKAEFMNYSYVRFGFINNSLKVIDYKGQPVGDVTIRDDIMSFQLDHGIVTVRIASSALMVGLSKEEEVLKKWGGEFCRSLESPRAAPTIEIVRAVSEPDNCNVISRQVPCDRIPSPCVPPLGEVGKPASGSGFRIDANIIKGRQFLELFTNKTIIASRHSVSTIFSDSVMLVADGKETTVFPWAVKLEGSGGAGPSVSLCHVTGNKETDILNFPEATFAQDRFGRPPLAYFAIPVTVQLRDIHACAWMDRSPRLMVPLCDILPGCAGR